MSPTTSRFFVNDQRVSTAVTTKNGDFLQVYPEKKVFTSEAEWRSFWEKEYMPKIRVETTSTPAPAAAAAPVAPASPAKKSTRAKKDIWTIRTDKRTVVMPPGEYYIGDLCYALDDAIYDNVFGNQGGYADGLYKKNNSTDAFFVAATAFGDGCYYGCDENPFYVDAGIIGIMSKSLLKKPSKKDANNLLASKVGDGGHFYTFDNPVTCDFYEGRFSFSSTGQYLMIDTTGDDDGY